MKKMHLDTEKDIFEQEKILLDDENNFCNLVAKKYLSKEIVITPMFSVPLLHIKMTNWESKKKRLLELFDESKKWLVNRDSVSTTYELGRHRQNKSKEQILERLHWEKQFSNVVDKIFYEERKIIYECFGNPENFPDKIAEINYAWFQEQKKGMFHAPHTHGNAPNGLGSVCFIQFDEKIHTPTQFISPFSNNLEYNFAETYAEKNISSGSLIVFPSNIFHYTLPSQDEKSRIIISLNMTV
jgi:hypothetical protein